MAKVSKVVRHVGGQEYVISEPAKLGDIFAYADNFFPDRRAVDAYLDAHRQDINDRYDRYFAFWEGGEKKFGSAYYLPGEVGFGAHPFNAENGIASTANRYVVLPSAPAKSWWRKG